MIKGVLTLEEAGRLSPAELHEKRAEGWLPPMAGGAALESNINGLWAAKQTGKGSPVTMTAGTKKFRWVGGDLQVNRADGMEVYSDGTLFGDRVDFVNTLIGNGAPIVMGQPGSIGYLGYLACGQEQVAAAVNAQQTLTSSGGATSGTFVLTFNGFVTAPIAYNAPAATIKNALLAAANPLGQTLPAGSITATGGPINTTPVVLTFGPATGGGPGLQGQPIPLITSNNTGLLGGSGPAITPSTTRVGSGNVHTITPSDQGGFYSTWVKSVGKSVTVRHQFNDCRIQSLRLEASSASKVMKATPTLLSLDPGQIVSADPTQADDGIKPFIFTEAAGAMKIDGTVFRGNSSFAAELQWGIQEWYGDDVKPFDLINVTADVLLQAITIILDANGLAEFNDIIYGNPTPTAGTKPSTTIPGLGSYEATFTRTNPYTGLTSEALDFSVPSVKWSPGLAIPANPAGGPVELPMAGEYRKVDSVTPPFTLLVTSSMDAGYSS